MTEFLIWNNIFLSCIPDNKSNDVCYKKGDTATITILDI